MNFKITKPGQNLKLVVIPRTIKGMGEPDVVLDILIGAPSGKVLLERRREVFKARRIGKLEVYNYRKEFPFYAPESGIYKLRLEAHSDYISVVAIQIKFEK